MIRAITALATVTSILAACADDPILSTTGPPGQTQPEVLNDPLVALIVAELNQLKEKPHTALSAVAGDSASTASPDSLILQSALDHVLEVAAENDTTGLLGT
jgi:hypothetical protein